MFHYQFHIRDYLTKTRHLSQTEDLAYRRLLDTYYTEEQPLPADPAQCARLIAMRESTAEVEAVLKEFFTLEQDGWHNARADLEIAAYHQRAEIARSNGARGGRPKKTQSDTESVPSGNPAGYPEETNSKANRKPITKNQEKNTPQAAVMFPEVSEKVVADFLKLRRALRAPITEIAVEGIKREAKKAGLSLEEALTMSVERSWRGFKAEWVKDKPTQDFDWDAELKGAI